MTKATLSLVVWMLLSACASNLAVAADNDISTGSAAGLLPLPLTLSAALASAMNEHPEMAAARAAVVAGSADLRQAGAIANPTVSFDVENFAGSESLQGFDGAETTLRLDQPIELGGQRAKRRASAMAEREIAVRRQELTQAELYVRTVEHFMTLLAAQERLLLSSRGLQDATQTVESIAAQVEAGKAPAIAAVRSRPLLVEARLEQQRASGALSLARSALAALLGGESAAELVVAGDLAALPELPAVSDAGHAPQLALAAAERERSDRELAVARAQAIPDVSVGFGVRRFEENGETALVAGFSVPLPLFDHNRGAIDAATARLEAARQQERATRQRLTVELETAALALANARAEALALQDELLPAAQQSFAALDYGYRAGKFDLLDLLDARRQLTEVQTRLLAAQVDCQVAAARLDALRGRFPLLEGGENLEKQ
jgi:cobalt-zinc-cadmium efflux system outer membrane protein